MSLAERLTETEAKVRILALFHGQPDAQLSVGEVLDALALPQGEIRDALRDFLEIGVLRSEPTYLLDQEKDREIQQDLIRDMQTDRVKSQQVPWTKSRQALGIPLLDGLVQDGFPAPASFLVLSEPECRKGVLCQQLALAVRDQGKQVVYAATEQDPQDIKSAISGMKGGWSDDILLFDMFSPQGEVEPTSEFSESPAELTSVSIALTGLLDRGVGLLIIDSCSTLLDLNGADPTLQFMRSLAIRSKRKGCSVLFTLNRRAYEMAVVARFQALADGIIELKADEDLYTGISTFLRISKLRGTRFDSRWTEYQVSPGVGYERKEV